MTSTEINIPFGGFYESMWSDILDHALEQTGEYDANERQGEDGIPSELRLDESVYHDALFDSCDYSAGHDHIARDYVDSLNYLITEETGLTLGLTFKAMESPREYNFATDRLFSDISMFKIRSLFEYSRKLDNHATLRNGIKERFTSYDGFRSFYSNDLDEWMNTPLEDWDHNEIGTLLRVVMSQLDSEWEWSIYYPMAESDYIYEQTALDYGKYESIIKEAREELENELSEHDPDYKPHPVRCDKTIDLFNNQ